MTKRTTEHTEMPNLAKFPEHEKEKIRLFVENLMAVKPPKVISNSSDNQINPEQDGLLFAALCYEAFGVSDHDLTNLFYGQLQAACPDNPRLQANDLNAALAFLFDVKPKNAIEGALAVQMMGTHKLAMGFLARSRKTDIPSEVITANVSRASKLMKAFANQIETLQRLRANCQQKVVVEHVHVHSGGQAIVGNVSQTTSNDYISAQGGADAKIRG